MSSIDVCVSTISRVDTVAWAQRIEDKARETGRTLFITHAGHRRRDHGGQGEDARLAAWIRVLVASNRRLLRTAHLQQGKFFA